MNRLHSIFLLLVFSMLLISCSGRSISPVDSTLRTPDKTVDTYGPQIWGLWDIAWNSDAGTFIAVPMRSAGFAVNVIKFINASGSNLIIKVNSIQHGADSVDFDLDIGLKHPFPGLDIYTGFDVMGVFMGQGSSTYPGPEGFAIGGSNDQQMRNPDGYTRRFNAPEFTGAGQIMPLQGYFPGSKGSPGYTPTSVVNPYKYYTDGLDANADAYAFLAGDPQDRGCYRPGSINYRNYRIRMPNSLLKFQYAIVANWEPNKNHPQPPAGIDDFPPSANSDEAVVISTYASGDAFWVSNANRGGHAILDITPWDWSATCSNTMDEYSIKLYSPAWTGPFMVDMTPTVLSAHHYTFQASIPGSSLLANGDQPVWVEVEYPGHDYASPVGVPNNASGTLAAYFTTQIHILDYNPHPMTDNFIYGIGDSQFFEYADQGDNARLFTNLLNLPLEGPYAQNKKVLYYEGHTGGYKEYVKFTEVVESLGYESVYVHAHPYVPLDTTGVKMVVLDTFYSRQELYSPEEIQAIKDLLNGGGICIILIDHPNIYDTTDTLEQLISELGAQFSCPMDDCSGQLFNADPYTDFTPDPITEGVNEVVGRDCGRFEVFGDAVGLMRGLCDTTPYTAICKSPWKG